MRPAAAAPGGRVVRVSADACRTNASGVWTSADPSELVLGKTDETTVKITNGPAKGDILARASTGEVTNMTNMGGGKYTARYGAPKVNFPQLGIVTLAAVITPSGDPISLAALSVPMYLFYELSIVIGHLLTRRRRGWVPRRERRGALGSAR